KTWNGHNFVVLVLAWPGGTEFYLQQFGLLFNDGAAFLDIFGNHIAAKRDNGGMTDDTVLENGEIRGSGPDIEQGNTCLFFFLAQYGISRCQRLQSDASQI